MTKSKIIKQISYCTIGNIFEWYDFTIFINLTPILAKLFFNTKTTNSLLYTLLIFAVGYMSRPIGAIFFGHFGDTAGRKSTLTITIFCMAIATTTIGLLPTTTIGVWGLLACRLLQGFACSGEYSGSLTLLSEQKSHKFNGLISSLGVFAAGLGMMLASSVYALICKFFGTLGMLNFAWRIPFLLSGVLGIIGYFIRNALVESEEFKLSKTSNQIVKIPLIEIIHKHYKELLLLLLLYIPPNVMVYINIAYLGNYRLSLHQLTEYQLMNLNFLISLAFTLSILLFGFLTTFFSEFSILLINCVLFVCFSYWMISSAIHGTVFIQIGSQILIAILLGGFFAPLAGLAARSFPIHVRYTGMSMIINFTAAIFGGTAPVVCSLINKFTNDITLASSFISLYIIIYFGIALCALIALKNLINIGSGK